jgi:hypothetical protein
MGHAILSIVPLANLRTTDSVEQRISGMHVPALIVWGDRDRAIHVGTADVPHGLLPRSQVMIERPNQSAED